MDVIADMVLLMASNEFLYSTFDSGFTRNCWFARQDPVLIKRLLRL